MPRGLVLALRLGAASCALAAGCAAPGSDVHAAPFYTRVSTVDGGVEVEALGGLWRHRRDADSGELDVLTVGPFYGLDPEPDGDWRAHYLVPFGFAKRRGEEASSFLMPLYAWNLFVEGDGSRTKQLLALPGIVHQKNDRRGSQFAWFPFWGHLEDFVTFDELRFYLWPLYVYADRSGRISHHILFPFLGWTTGGGERSWHVFPLVGRASIEGRYDRTWVLWPIFHFQRNFLGGGGEEPETVWMVFPLVGRSERGTYRAWTWLWPFFGWASDPRSGFWAWDGPWFFVRLQRGPGETERTRFWPFFGVLKTKDQTYRTYLWPFVHFRSQETSTYQRETKIVIPFWQSWDRRELATGETSAWRKLFPLFQYEREGERYRASFPTLDPLWKNELVDRFYSWMWKLHEWQGDGRVYRSRSWLGLYRREKGPAEDRRSIAGLWARRKSTLPDGRRVKQTSLLFGLLRWSVTGDEGFDMLRPAFPGPGWPAHARTEPELAPGFENGGAADG